MRRRLAFQLTVRGTEPEDGEADREGESKPERLVERERERRGGGGGGYWQPCPTERGPRAFVF